ncbi:MAG: hypothetical protein JNK05_26030 [Myxococcales bacterium]|nr:hypothetical protein [Myxococcales bacterium]
MNHRAPLDRAAGCGHAKSQSLARRARGAIVVVAAAAMSCGTSTRGVIPTSDGGVNTVRSPYCSMFTGNNIVRTDSITMILCSPEMPEGAPCAVDGQPYQCTSLERWSPDLAEYYRTNRVPRICRPSAGRDAQVPCRGDVGQGCGSGSVCVPGLRGLDDFPVCVPLPCNN